MKTKLLFTLAFALMANLSQAQYNNAYKVGTYETKFVIKTNFTKPTEKYEEVFIKLSTITVKDKEMKHLRIRVGIDDPYEFDRVSNVMEFKDLEGDKKVTAIYNCTSCDRPNQEWYAIITFHNGYYSITKVSYLSGEILQDIKLGGLFFTVYYDNRKSEHRRLMENK